MSDHASTSWDEVFGGLDARTLDREQRLQFINARITRVLRGKDWAATSGGEESELVWEAAVRSFLEENWVATLLCCHAVCERELAGIISLCPDDKSTLGWKRWGMGKLLVEVRQLGRIPPGLFDDLLALTENRKPYGHWRSFTDVDSITSRIILESETTGNFDRRELTERLLVRDATRAMTTTIDLRFGSYGLGGP